MASHGPRILHTIAKENKPDETRSYLSGLQQTQLDQLTEKEDVGQIPLHYAAVFGNELFLKLAYEKLGRSVEWFNWKDNNSRVPLHLSVWNDHKLCVDFLLEIGVDKDAQEKGGYTPLYFAVYRQNVDMVQKLLMKGCNISITSYPMESLLTPLNQACILGNVEIVELLTGSKLGDAVPNRELLLSNAKLLPESHQAKDARGRSSRSASTATSEEEFEKHKQKLFIDLRDANGNTPLISAIRNRKLDVVKLLLKLGADPTIADKHQDTPLHLAVNANLTQYVQELLPHLTHEQRAALNKNKCTALDIAHTNDNLAMAKLLQEAGGLDATEEHDERNTCMICTHMLYQPAKLACGHTFCLYCATCSVKPERGGLCPFRCKEQTKDLPVVDVQCEKELKEKHSLDYQRREAVFYKQRANANLQEFMRHSSQTSLAFNENNTCEIVAHDLTLKATLLRKELYVYHVLLKSLPEETSKRLEVLSLILEGNCLGSLICSGSISILTNGEVVMAMSAQLAVARNTALREVITVFTKCAQGWHRRLDAVLSGQAGAGTGTDPRSIQIVSESPAPVLLSERVGTFEKARLLVEHFKQHLHQNDSTNLHFDGNKTWYLKNPRLSLSITYELRSDSLYMYSPVWNGLPKRPDVKVRLYEQLLRLNLFFTELPGGGIGIDVHGDFILMHCILQLGSVPHTTLGDCTQLFMSQVDRCIQCANQNVNQFSTLYRAKKDKQDDEKLLAALKATVDCASLSGAMDLDLALQLHKNVQRWNETNNATALKLAVVVGTGATGFADAVIADNTLHRLGFNVMLFAGARATLENVMHALNFCWTLAQGKRVCCFHFHFSGLGAEYVLENQAASQVLLLDNDTPLPTALLRHFAELLANSEVNSTQIVLDTDYRRFLAPCLTNPILRSFPWSRGYQLRHSYATWANLSPQLWVVEACHPDEQALADSVPTPPGAHAGRLTRSLYFVLSSSVSATVAALEVEIAKHGVDPEPKDELASPAQPEDQEITLGYAQDKQFHFAQAPELHRRKKERKEEHILGSHAFKSCVERIFYLTRVLMFSMLRRTPQVRLHTDPSDAGIPVEQNPRLHCHPATRTMKPFADERPVVDEVLDDTYTTAAVGVAEQRRIDLLAGRLHSVYEGQVFALLDPVTKRHTAYASVCRVEAAVAQLDILDSSRLEAGKAYLAVDVWHRVGDVHLHDERLAVWMQCVHENMQARAPIFANRMWLDDVSPVRLTSDLPHSTSLMWIQIHPGTEPPVIKAPLLDAAPMPLDVLEEAAKRGEEHLVIAQRLWGRRQSIGATIRDLERDASLGFPIITDLVALMPRYQPLRALADALDKQPLLRDLFVDVFTGGIKFDPVVSADGHTYEREPLEAWLRHCTTSPTTGEYLLSVACYSCQDFKRARDHALLTLGLAESMPSQLPLLDHPSSSDLQPKQAPAATDGPVPDGTSEIPVALPTWLCRKEVAGSHAQATGPEPKEAAPKLAHQLRQLEEAYQLSPFVAWRMRALFKQECDLAPRDRKPAVPRERLEESDGADVVVSGLDLWNPTWVDLDYCALLQPLSVENAEEKWVERWKILCMALKKWAQALLESSTREAHALFLTQLEEQTPDLHERELLRTATTQLTSSASPSAADDDPFGFYYKTLEQTEAFDGFRNNVVALWHAHIAEARLPATVQAVETLITALAKKLQSAEGQGIARPAMAILARHASPSVLSRIPLASAEIGSSPLPQTPPSVPAIKSLLLDSILAQTEGDSYNRLQALGVLATRLYAFLTCGDWGVRTLHQQEDPAPLGELSEARATISILKDALLWSDNKENMHALTLPAMQQLAGEYPESPNKYVLTQSFSSTEVDRAKSLIKKTARCLRKLRVAHSPQSCLRKLSHIKVSVRHEKQDKVLQQYDLTTVQHHVSLELPVAPGDIIRMIPTIAGCGDETLKCFMYLYDFLPSMGVTMLDRAPIHLQTTDNNRFPGTGGVIEWETDYLAWRDAADPDKRTLVLEHFKLYFCTHDVNPIQLMKHVFEEAPRTATDEVEWCAFTVSFQIQRPSATGK